MPDRATIIAATPRCPVGPNRPGLQEEPEPCDAVLAYQDDDGGGGWHCRTHGIVTTTQSLVHRQGASTC
jgi:hypothetical protein